MIHRAENIFYLALYEKDLPTPALEMFSSSEVHKISYWIPYGSQESYVNLEIHKRKGLIKTGVEGRKSKIHGERTTGKMLVKNLDESKEKTQITFNICIHFKKNKLVAGVRE